MLPSVTQIFDYFLYEPDMYDYRVALLLVVGLYIFSPVIIDWWLAPNGAWYHPFAFWFLLIAVYIWVESKRGPDEF